MNGAIQIFIFPFFRFERRPIVGPGWKRATKKSFFFSLSQFVILTEKFKTLIIELRKREIIHGREISFFKNLACLSALKPLYPL